MRDVITCQQDRAHKLRCAQDLTDRAEKENRAMTVEECQIFDVAVKDVELLDAEIKEIEATRSRREALQKKRDELAQGSRQAPAQPVAATTTQMKIFASPKRHGKMWAFTGPDAEEKATRAGMWARAVLFKDQRAATWCENNFSGFRNALAENVNESGGVLVPDELAQTIIDLREQYGVFRQQALVWPMKSDTAIIPRRTGGVTMYFTAENPSAAPTESNPTWNQVQLTAKKAAGLTRMSTEIDEDAIIDMGQWLADEVAYAAAYLEDQCGFIGDGTSTYGGIRGLGNIFTAGAVAGAVDATSGHDTFAEIDATDLATVMAKLPAYARMNAKWYASTVALDLVFGRLMMAAGGNTINDQAVGYQPRYAGYPIVISQVLPTSTSTINNVPMLYFGDLRKAATLGSRRDIRVFPSQHRYMELDQIGIFFSTRFDIVVHDYGDGTNAGPIVALVGNT